MDSFLEDIDAVLASAKRLLDSPEENEDVFLALVSDYQARFEALMGLLGDGTQLKDESVPVERRQEYRSLLLRVQTQHELVVKTVEKRKAGVADELGALFKRGKALRTYVDHYPERITIAGKRKG